MNIFKEIGDLERMTAKISTGRISPRELIQFKNSLKKIKETQDQCKKIKIIAPLKLLVSQLNNCLEVVSSIESHLNEEAPVLLSKGNVIKSNVSKELDEYRNITISSEKILEDIRIREIENTIKT